MRRIWLWLEFLGLFGGLPLVVLAVRDRGFMIALLWGMAALIFWVLHHFYKRSHAAEWNRAGLKAGSRNILLLFLGVLPVFVIVAMIFLPESFLSLPRQRPQLWLMIMLLYPLLSVWPQELLYRSFIYHRYAPIFGTGKGFITASALSFSFLHVIFLNPVAVLLTLGGGFLFARSYAKHHSLALACLEHALYGCMLFTLGYGPFFFSGQAWR